MAARASDDEREFLGRIDQTVYLSATPGPYELAQSEFGRIKSLLDERVGVVAVHVLDDACGGVGQRVRMRRQRCEKRHSRR